MFFTPVCQPFCTRDDGLCMMLLPVWLPGPMFLLREGGLLLWSHVPSRGVSVSGPMFLLGGLSPGGLADRHPLNKGPPGERPPLDRDPPPGQRPPSWTKTSHLERDHPWTETSFLDRDLPPGQRPPFMVKSGRYASYCNAFLLLDRPITDQC